MLCKTLSNKKGPHKMLVDMTPGVSRPPVEAPSDATKAAKLEAVGTVDDAN